VSVLTGDLNCYGSAVMPDDDSVLDIGGAVDRTRTVEFVDVGSDSLQAVSSSAADVTQSVDVAYRDATGVALSLSIALAGQAVVSDATVVERILKAVKDLTCAGDVALEAATAVLSGTLSAGGLTSATLPVGASPVDDAYRGLVLRETNGARRIRKVVRYTGASRVAVVDRAWGGSPPDGTTTFRLSAGAYFPKLPFEVFEVRRPFYAASSDPLVAKTYYEKVFLSNEHATLALLEAVVSEYDDPGADIEFALETTLDGSGTNGAGNSRQVAPSAGVGAFSSADKPAVGSVVGAGQAQGTWLKLSLPADAPAQNTTYTVALTGTSI
jgi:hypothetical protein